MNLNIIFSIVGFIIWIILYVKKAIFLLDTQAELKAIKTVLKEKIVCPNCNAVYIVTNIEIGDKVIKINIPDEELH